MSHTKDECFTQRMNASHGETEARSRQAGQISVPPSLRVSIKGTLVYQTLFTG